MFTRFDLARGPAKALATFNERWGSMTIEELGPRTIDLCNGPRAVPARVFDKHVYSDRHQQLGRAQVHSIIITGDDTYLYILAITRGAVDWAFQVIQ